MNYLINQIRYDKNNLFLWEKLTAELIDRNNIDDTIYCLKKCYKLTGLKKYKDKIKLIKCSNSNSVLDDTESEDDDDFDLLNDKSFQQKILKNQHNPLEALKDPQIFNFVEKMSKKLKFN